MLTVWAIVERLYLELLAKIQVNFPFLKEVCLSKQLQCQLLPLLSLVAFVNYLLLILFLSDYWVHALL